MVKLCTTTAVSRIVDRQIWTAYTSCMRRVRLPPTISLALLCIGNVICSMLDRGVQAAASAVVINLLRSLAWHRRMAAEALLPPQEQQRLEAVAADLGDTLRTLLLL